MNHFVGLGLGGAGAKTSGEIDGHGFGDESGTGVESEDAPPAGGGVSGFLKEFALGRRERLFAGIDASGRKLPEIVVSGMAVLTLQQDARCRTGVVDG